LLDQRVRLPGGPHHLHDDGHDVHADEHNENTHGHDDHSHLLRLQPGHSELEEDLDGLEERVLLPHCRHGLPGRHLPHDHGDLHDGHADENLHLDGDLHVDEDFHIDGHVHDEDVNDEDFHDGDIHADVDDDHEDDSAVDLDEDIYNKDDDMAWVLRCHFSSATSSRIHCADHLPHAADSRN